MDVSEILDRIVGEAGRTTSEPAESGLEPVARPPAPLPGAPTTVVRFADDGWVRRVDRGALVAVAQPGGVVTLATDAGRYALRESPVCTIWPPVPADQVDDVTTRVREAVRLGPTRTVAEDAGYGVRQLVDVALKGLSPGVNDPTTARDAIFHLGTVLVARLTSPAAPVAYRDGDDRVLVAAKALTDEDLAELAVGELRLAAAPHPAVCTALLAMIADVVDAARRGGAAGRIGPFVDQARLLVDGMEERVLLDHDRRLVRRTYDKRFGAGDGA